MVKQGYNQAKDDAFRERLERLAAKEETEEVGPARLRPDDTESAILLPLIMPYLCFILGLVAAAVGAVVGFNANWVEGTDLMTEAGAGFTVMRLAYAGIAVLVVTVLFGGGKVFRYIAGVFGGITWFIIEGALIDRAPSLIATLYSTDYLRAVSEAQGLLARLF